MIATGPPATAPAAEPLLRVADVSRHYGGRRDRFVALHRANLDLDEGVSIGIVGESGSGKSTLAKLIVGLDRPSTGTVRFRGRDVATLGRGELLEYRRAVQFVGQDTFSSFDPRRTLGDAVRQPLVRLLGLDTRTAAERIHEMLDELSLPHSLLHRYPFEVSGGQRQRFALARALVVRPRLLVCDEVVSALDVSVQGAVLNLLKRHRRSSGTGLVFVSHGLPAVAFVCERLVVMYQGNMVEEGPTAEVLRAPSDPYTGQLVAAFRRTDGREVAVRA